MKFILLVALCLIPSVCLSSPDKYTEYLINTPVSLHDFAIYQTNLGLKNFLFEVKTDYRSIIDESNAGWAQMGYDLSKDKYTVTVAVYTDKAISKKTSMDFLRQIIILVKKSFGAIEKNDSITFPLYNASYFSGLMNHQGYSDVSKPKNLSKEIDKKIVIEASLSEKSKEYKCTSKLVSTKLDCHE